MNKKTKKKSALTFEKVWALIQETDKILTEKFQETDKKFKETDKILTEKFQETDKILTEKFQETDKKIKELGKMIGGMSNNIGDAAEDFFYNGLSTTMQVGGIKYDIIERNVRRKTGGKEGEFDTLLINSRTVLVVEVKYKIHPGKIKIFMQEQLPLFKELYREYQGYKIYGAVAGFAIPRETLKLAQQNGLYVFTQKGDMVTTINEPGFRAVAF